MGAEPSFDWDVVCLRKPKDWLNSSLGSIFIERIERGNANLSLLSVTKTGLKPQEETERRNISNDDKSRYKVVKLGDIAYNTMRMWQGRSAYADKEGIVSPAYTVVTPSSNLDPCFASYLLKFPSLVRKFRAISQGLVSDTWSLKFAEFAKIQAPIPPLLEQRKIAAILRSVDEAIQATRAVIEQTRRVKQGLLQELLTKGIGHDGRPHTRFKQTPIGQIPEEWEVKRLGEFVRKVTDGTHQSVKTKGAGSHRFLYVTCVRPGRIIWENTSWIDEAEYLRISKGRAPVRGCILYTAVGATLGYAAVVDTDELFSFQRHLAIIYPEPSLIRPGLLASILNSPRVVRKVWRLTVGNAQPSITLGELRNLQLPLPPLDEQDRLSSILSSVDNSINIGSQRFDQLQKTKTGLLQDLLSGKVRVSP